MKKLILSASLISLFAVSITVFTHKQNSTAQYVPDNFDVELSYENGFSDAAEYLFNRTANLETGEIDIKDVENARAQVQELAETKTSMGLNWSFAGPTNIGGRCRSIVIDKDDSNLIYVGSVSGGLWKSETGGSSWSQILYSGDDETGGIPNLNVNTIAQASNGDIYFGTGEFFANPYGNRNSGFQGAGIWKSTDGETFTRLSSTWNDDESKSTFVFVNKMVAHPSDANMLFAATRRGLQVTSDGGETWENPILNVAGLPIKDASGDVEISSDGEYIIVDLGTQAYVSHEGGDVGTWEKVTGSSSDGKLPTSSIRTEYSIAPSDKNIIYAQATNSDKGLLNVYRSEDGGLTWFVIGPGGSDTFNPLGDQGGYDNIIAVYPDNADEIILGGQYSLWHWEITEGWEQLTFWNLPIYSSAYVHADQHEITFSPTNPDIIYCGSDGGIHRSIDRGQHWVTMNKNFGVTQFYGIGHSGTGQLLGGTQDNGSLYIDNEASVSSGTEFEAIEVTGGDGGYSEISQIDENIMFTTLYYSTLYRSEERGENMASPYNARINTLMEPGNRERNHPFVTPIALWESFNDPYSIDTLVEVARRDYSAGEVVFVESNIKEKYVRVVLEQDYMEGDMIYAIDHYQSLFAAGFCGGLWVTRDALSLRKSAYWVPVVELADTTTHRETVSVIEWSKDGDILYFAVESFSSQGMSGSKLYRVSGFIENRIDSLMDYTRSGYALEKAQIAIFPGRTITGIGVDPEVSGNVVVTLGNYSSDDYIYYSTNANVAPNVTGGTGTFVSKQGDLPEMPVYDAVILWNDSRKVIVGTEFGVFATADITATSPSWTDENNGMDHVPVFQLRQQVQVNGFIDEIIYDTKVINHGYIWAGTHARGIFACNDFAGPVGIDPVVDNTIKKSMSLYPNPTSDYINIDFEMEQAGMVYMHIFDIQGKLVRAAEFDYGKGQHHKMINLSNLEDGVYIMKTQINGKVSTEQFIIN